MPNIAVANWLISPFWGLPNINHEIPVNKSGVKNGMGSNTIIVRRNGTSVRATAQANSSAKTRLIANREEAKMTLLVKIGIRSNAPSQVLYPDNVNSPSRPGCPLKTLAINKMPTG